MINFLRKLRKREVKSSRYIKYAIGEIALVVIGILIALSINNWNEERKIRKREHALLLQLSEELTDTKRELETDLRNAKIYYQMTDSLIHYDKEKSLHPLSYYFMPKGEDSFYNNSLLFGNKSTYTTLKSTGLEIIKNPVLRNNITDMYERRLSRVGGTEDVIFQYEDRLLVIMERSFERHYHEDSKEFVLIPKDYQTYQKNKEFQNALITLQRYRRALLERYMVIDSMTTVIQHLILEETKN